MELVKCPFCGKEIEDNSFYCDQCGELLKMCPTHGFKKGKICSDCGTKLIEAKDAVSTDSATAGSPPQPATPPQQPVVNSLSGQPSASQQPQPTPQVTPPQNTIGGTQPVFQPDAQPSAVEKTVRPNVVVAPRYLVNQQLGARLELINQAIVGRKTGSYVSVFGSQSYVSGTHARLQQNLAGGWEIVDLDSSNGTFLNGTRLAANQPAAFKIGDVIAFYDIKFTVE